MSVSQPFRSAVVPGAGLGTRFQPTTEAVSTEISVAGSPTAGLVAADQGSWLTARSKD